MDDPEGNLVIVERVVHENQRCFPDWEHGWVGTAHVLTSTQDGTVEQKEVKYIVPFFFYRKLHFAWIRREALPRFRITVRTKSYKGTSGKSDSG